MLDVLPLTWTYAYQKQLMFHHLQRQMTAKRLEREIIEKTPFFNILSSETLMFSTMMTDRASLHFIGHTFIYVLKLRLSQ